MRMIVDPQLTRIENIDLFNSVLLGKEERVAKFTFDPSQYKPDKVTEKKPQITPGEGQFQFSESEFEDLRKEINKEKNS